MVRMFWDDLADPARRLVDPPDGYSTVCAVRAGNFRGTPHAEHGDLRR
jgi:hypothetical protein